MSLPGGWELIIIIIIIFILFSGKRVKDSIKNIGQGVYKAKKEINEIKNITKKI